MAWSESPVEYFPSPFSVVVDPDADRFRWFAQSDSITIGDICSKWGCGDGAHTLTDEDDDYHQDTLALVSETLAATGEYDMEKSIFYVVPSFHNSFRGDAYLLTGEIDQFPVSTVEAWMKVPKILLSGEAAEVPSCILVPPRRREVSRRKFLGPPARDKL